MVSMFPIFVSNQHSYHTRPHFLCYHIGSNIQLITTSPDSFTTPHQMQLITTSPGSFTTPHQIQLITRYFSPHQMFRVIYFLLLLHYQHAALLLYQQGHSPLL
uniref:Uncharacterized protein n=1 Tax=Cacopsylla melanoneura TaxID=428564 RepID=A0A8D9E556_9HEMI